MLDTVLVANRGAIAVRIIRTLKKLGVRSVAVYAEADRHSLHVYDADVALSLGEGAATQTYLNVGKLLDAAAHAGAQAVHPGYGFLSEDPAFVQACFDADLIFLGPTPEQIRAFGLKDRARQLASDHGVPLLPGSPILGSVDDALLHATRVGYPVMLKSIAGGGGIGMQRCADSQALRSAYDSVTRLATRSFASGGVYLERLIDRARHIEVQIFGDGVGDVIAFGTRDCSLQRRNQKVLEESPAPNLSPTVRSGVEAAALRLAKSVRYRSAGTVEFLYDVDGGQFYFLEVNTRLQVEHGVTEMVYGVDLVEWMVRLGAGELSSLRALAASCVPSGHAIQARVYAEDPARDFRPSAGTLSNVSFPVMPAARVDSWVESGSEVSPHFDPLLAKIIVHGEDRESARRKLAEALIETRIYGLETNLGYLRDIVQHCDFVSGAMLTSTLAGLQHRSSTMEVRAPGTLTTVQDADGRAGYWHVGVPPSGAYDSRSFRIGNALLANDSCAAGLEITVFGPTIHFQVGCSIVITGAPVQARIDGRSIEQWRVVDVHADQILEIGAVSQGVRAYLLLAGGIDCPPYLGSRSTFTLGRFGGHLGRQLRAGDVLHLAKPELRPSRSYGPALLPEKGRTWTLRTIYGPHGAPEFFTDSDIEVLFAQQWLVHHNSSRTGIRLIGPSPTWARRDGGEAGMHPSNIHDNAYAFGAVDFTGDMPVILGPDGPSLGGFVCPATVVEADRWKLGQLVPGDRLVFEPVNMTSAIELVESRAREVSRLERVCESGALERRVHDAPRVHPVLAQRPATGSIPQVTYRISGDRFVLIEYGEPVLDIALRLRVHALMQWLQANPLPGMEELTPGIRSCQIHYDSTVLPTARLLDHLAAAEEAVGTLDDARVPSRIVHLPLSWNDPVCQLAIDRYDQSVRPNAPWAPNNIEFIRRINGLETEAEVKRIVFDASYLVMGLGDVYLGAPVAVPLDPRHRLVTTKYNPARTWTAENSVGIGGAYLCVYGMEGPGGYQLVGRTLQMWDRDPDRTEKNPPWLLRYFDQIRFHEVGTQELAQMREDLPRGSYQVEIETTEFSLAAHRADLHNHADSIQAFEDRRRAAFDEERQQWHDTGQLQFDSAADTNQALVRAVCEIDNAEGCEVVSTLVTGTLWEWRVQTGEQVVAGQVLAIVEAMKMEVAVTATVPGQVRSLHCSPGEGIVAGQTLLLLQI